MTDAMTTRLASAPTKRRKPPVGTVPGTVQSLRRGLQVLNAIADAGALPLTDIARGLGVPLSTAHHLVKTLETQGYVSQRKSGGEYRLGNRVFRLAGAAWDADDIGVLAEPFLEDLTLKTGETSNLAISDRGQVFVIARFESEGPWRMFQRVGAPRPAYCVATGKLLMAFQRPSTVRQYLAAIELKPLTPKTITSRTLLEQELRKTRNQGYAVDNEEFLQGIRCVAAPVCNFSDQVVAALGLFGPLWRIPDERLGDVVSTLMAISERFSRELGYRGEYPPPPEPKQRPSRRRPGQAIHGGLRA